MKESKNAGNIKSVRFLKDASSVLPGHHPEDLPAEILDMYPEGISRRRFLSLLSASAALAMGASCSKIDRGSIVPYTKRPGEIKPGVAAYYASTFQEGWIAQGVLVKTREGRPIHIEGNPDHPVSGGTVSLRAMGDLLGLYDPDRLRGPMFHDSGSTWEEAIAAMAQALSKAHAVGTPVLLMTGAVISPSLSALIDDMKSTWPLLRHVCWEPAGPQSQALMTSALYMESVIPRLHMERADVVLSLQSDFLGNEGNVPVSIRDFASRRGISGPSDPMNRLWVAEGPMTLTGANADERIRVKPSAMVSLVFTLIRMLNESHGIPLPFGLAVEDLKPYALEKTAAALDLEPSKLKRLAGDLAEARGAALILAGPALPAKACLASYLLTGMVGSFGNTADPDEGIRIPKNALTNMELQNLLRDAAEGAFTAAIFWGVNPAYAFPVPSLWNKAIKNIPETFRIGLYEDETALACDWRLPEHHWLESWGDFESSSGYTSLRQPAIGPLHDTRQGEDFFLACMQNEDLNVPDSYLEYIKTRWESGVYSKNSPVDFKDFWNAALQSGGAPDERARVKFRAGWKGDEIVAALSSPENLQKTGVPDGTAGITAGENSDPERTLEIAWNVLLNQLKVAASDAENPSANKGMELVLTCAAGVYDGRYANNGWLNELPDPVSKATWENPVALSIRDAERIGVRNGDIVAIVSGNVTVEAPALIQPGQCNGVASMALGYGRRSGNVAAGIGANAYPLLGVSPVSPLCVTGAVIRRADSGGNRTIPFTQTHDRMEGRDLVRTRTLSEFIGNSVGEEHGETNHYASLIPEGEFPEHKWSMTVDLSACVGCGTCVVACQSENNIAVVGPERILKGRHMHWIRIDRYYEGDMRNPKVLHQPMFCQHCDDAPCEIVCPVNATTHSSEGLNQMTYNRCVGTRYCSNNCPFKVRRFNFFEYSAMKTEPESLVFNPEVTVRPRGVMEKCTFCIQRIQNAKQKAKVEGRSLKDGDIVPACAGACPANAILFGDLKDPESRMAKLSRAGRAYKMLEELGVKPSVTYLADISNPAAGEEEV